MFGRRIEHLQTNPILITYLQAACLLIGSLPWGVMVPPDWDMVGEMNSKGI